MCVIHWFCARTVWDGEETPVKRSKNRVCFKKINIFFRVFSEMSWSETGKDYITDGFCVSGRGSMKRAGAACEGIGSSILGLDLTGLAVEGELGSEDSPLVTGDWESCDLCAGLSLEGWEGESLIGSPREPPAPSWQQTRLTEEKNAESFCGGLRFLWHLDIVPDGGRDLVDASKSDCGLLKVAVWPLELGIQQSSNAVLPFAESGDSALWRGYLDLYSYNILTLIQLIHRHNTSSMDAVIFLCFIATWYAYVHKGAKLFYVDTNVVHFFFYTCTYKFIVGFNYF